MQDMKQITIDIPQDLYLQIRMTSIHNATTEKLTVEMILKTYYNSRKKD